MSSWRRSGLSLKLFASQSAFCWQISTFQVRDVKRQKHAKSLHSMQSFLLHASSVSFECWDQQDPMSFVEFKLLIWLDLGWFEEHVTGAFPGASSWIWQRLIHLGWGQAGERYHRQISGFGAGASDTKVRECFQHVLRLDGLMYVSWSFMIIHDLLSNVVNRSSNNILNDGLSRYSLGTTCWEISPGHTTQRSAGFASGRCALAKL